MFATGAVVCVFNGYIMTVACACAGEVGVFVAGGEASEGGDE